MALSQTSLSGATTAGAGIVALTSATGVSVGTLLKVDAEWMRVHGTGPTATTFYVARGLNGSAAVAHAALAPVVLGPSTDFSSGYDPPVISVSVDGAIGVPKNDQLVLITKGSVAALTLVGPAKDQTNTLTIVSTTAFAHTVTYLAGILGDTTGSDIITFAAKVGASITLRAQSGVWGPIALSSTTAA